MHDYSVAAYGWQFCLESLNGDREYHTLDSLDHHFHLGLRGSTWEAAFVARRVATLANARVEASFNGVQLAVAEPFFG
jgi:hypothetical protein